jgi:L-asparaginase II
MPLVKMVEVWRGQLVESVHLGVAAVANAKGEIIAGWGDVSMPTYPRSALKPIQAIALVETGAYEAHRLTTQHLALACGSHRGEAFHSNLVASWLAALGLDENALACGPDYPADPATAADVLRDGQPKRRLYHNCSGKHCGFLTVSRHRGWPVEGYDHLDHPAQQLYLDALSEMTGRDAHALPFGIDGCNLPAAAMPIGEMAATMARFAARRTVSPQRKAAIVAIQAAMRKHPEYVSGSDQPGVQVDRATSGRIIVKTGAEGFIAALVPDQGVAVALKIADGEARARVPALIALLAATRLLSEAEQKELAALAGPPVTNSRGVTVGGLRACGFGMLDPPPHAH